MGARFTTPFCIGSRGFGKGSECSGFSVRGTENPEIILDANAISALAQQDKALTDLVQAASCIAVTIVSLGEYAFGISQSRHRGKLEDWLDALLLKVDVLILEQKTLPFYAEVQNGRHPDLGE